MAVGSIVSVAGLEVAEEAPITGAYLFCSPWIDDFGVAHACCIFPFSLGGQTEFFDDLSFG